MPRCGAPDADHPASKERIMSMASRRSVLATIGAAGLLAACSRPEGSSASELVTNSRASLDQLYATNPSARALGERARGVLVFPNIVEGGLIVGAQGGKGVLFRGREPAGFYSIGSASVGLQAGAQSYARAIFFMTDEALRYLEESRGFEVGGDAAFTIADAGIGGDVSTTTARAPIVAFAYGQQGLLGGVSVQGSKITKLEGA
jgi:lipid-binding SYLF domain-containing protein